MRPKSDERLTIEQEELRGISRTVAEIEWLLLVLVLLYLVFGAPADEARPPIAAGLVVYIVFILAFHYTLLNAGTRWTVALQTWVMIVFITWSLWFTGRMGSPLVNAYLLVIITGALTLGKLATLLETTLIVACVILLGEQSSASSMFSLAYIGGLAAQLAPMLLVAYVTTLFSGDIRYGLNKAMLMSETDELTGLHNRRGFAILADRLFAQAARYNRPVSILMIDSDNLKTINDGHGHQTGDRLLKTLAKCVAVELRQTDVVARYGGDEFVALLPDTPPAGASIVAERIRSAVAAASIMEQGPPLATSVSIGIASYPENGGSIDAVLARADKALYAAKAQGRNRVVKFAD